MNLSTPERDHRRNKLQRLAIDYRNPDPAALSRAAALLRSDRLVVAPTETRYGLLCRADSAAALERLVRAKGRDRKQAVSVFVDSPASLWRLGEKTPAAALLAERFLPGPMTLVLRALVHWSAPIVIDGKIGLRLSDAPVILRILREAGGELTATSANRSGSPDLTSVDEIAAQLGDDVALYLDAGELDGRVSTVVDATTDPPVVLREGAISRLQLAEALNNERT